MMIKEGERAIRRTEEWIRGTFGSFGKRLVETINLLMPRWLTSRGTQTLATSTPLLTESKPGRALGYKIGPVPHELRQDPFLSGSIPWSIREDEKRADRVREKMILGAVVVVSYSVAIVALLRTLRVL